MLISPTPKGFKLTEINWEMVTAYANSSDKSTARAGEQFIYDNAMKEE